MRPATTTPQSSKRYGESYDDFNPQGVQRAGSSPYVATSRVTLQNTNANSNTHAHRLSLPSSRFEADFSGQRDWDENDSFGARTPSSSSQQFNPPYNPFNSRLRPATAGSRDTSVLRSSVLPHSQLAYPSNPVPRYSPAVWENGTRDTSIGGYMGYSRPGSAAASYASVSSSSAYRNYPPPERPGSSISNSRGYGGADPFFDAASRRKDSFAVDYASDYDSNASVTSSSRRYPGGGGGGSAVYRNYSQRRVEFDEDNLSLTSDRVSESSHQYHPVKQKPTLTPNYPSRPGSATSTHPQPVTTPTQESAAFSPRLRAASTDPEHSSLPKLGSHQRYIQSLLEKTGKPGSPLGPSSTSSTVLSPKGLSTPSTTAGSGGQYPQQQQQQHLTRQSNQFLLQNQQSQVLPTKQPLQQQQQQQQQQSSNISATAPPPAFTPAVATNSGTTSPEPTSKSLRRLKNQSLSGNSLREAAATPESGAAFADALRGSGGSGGGGASSSSESRDTTLAGASSSHRASTDSLTGEIESMRNTVGALEKRFGGSGTISSPSLSRAGGDFKSIGVIDPSVSSRGDVAQMKSATQPLQQQSQQLDSAIEYLSRSIGQISIHASEMNKLIRSHGPAADAVLLNMSDNQVAQLKSFEGIVELVRGGWKSRFVPLG